MEINMLARGLEKASIIIQTFLVATGVALVKIKQSSAKTKFEIIYVTKKGCK